MYKRAPQATIREFASKDIEQSIGVISEHLIDEKAEARRPVLERAGDSSDANGVVAEVGGDVVGCMIYTLHDSDEGISDELSRPIPHSTDTEYAILRYAYLHPDYMGEGFGTQMLERVLDMLESGASTPPFLYVEAWHRPHSLDLRPLLDKFEFTPVFVSEDYWADPAYSGRMNTCPDCGVAHVACDCGAGVYRRSLA